MKTTDFESAVTGDVFVLRPDTRFWRAPLLARVLDDHLYANSFRSGSFVQNDNSGEYRKVEVIAEAVIDGVRGTFFWRHTNDGTANYVGDVLHVKNRQVQCIEVPGSDRADAYAEKITDDVHAEYELAERRRARHDELVRQAKDDRAYLTTVDEAAFNEMGIYSPEAVRAARRLVDSAVAKALAENCR